MPDAATLTLTPDELERLVERACEAAVARAFALQAGKLGTEWSIGDVASHLGVSERTVLRMESRGELPRRAGRKWRKADVLQWRQDRVSAAGGPT